MSLGDAHPIGFYPQDPGGSWCDAVWQWGRDMTIANKTLCVWTKQDVSIVDLLRRVNRDIEESRSHEIVREDDIWSIAEEAAAHLAYSISINSTPPSFGFTLSPDLFFSVPEGARDGLDHKIGYSLLVGSCTKQASRWI